MENFSQSFELNQYFKEVRNQTIHKTNKKTRKRKKRLPFSKVGASNNYFRGHFLFFES